MENNIGKGEEEGEERLIPAASPLKPRHKLLTSGVPNQSARVRLGLTEIAALVTLYLVWGSTYLAIRFAITTIPPFLMAGLRMLVAGSLMYVWGRTIGGAPRPTRDEWRETAIVGAFLLLGGNGFVVWAAQRIPSGVLALLVGATPVFMVLIGWLVGHDPRPRLLTWLGLLAGFLGLSVLVGPQTVVHGQALDLAGSLAAICATISWAIGSNYARSARLPKSRILTIAMEMLTGGVMLVMLGVLAGEAPRLHWGAISSQSLIAFAYLVVFGSIVGFSAYIYLLEKTRPALATSYAFVNPLVAVFLGWALASEQITARIVVATPLIVGAVVLISVDRARTKEQVLAEEVEVA
ncbi:MAG: drug/metabolite exporter YedA [Candidatus Sumerlaea sp.]|nr:MAG: drug/metabolite exporter YedA [Candidatus Sumerlaea sp.]